MIHAFDDNVAMTVGVKGAIILNHIAWWVKRNEASNINFHDGHYWTYNTSEAYTKIFPFFSADVIRKELRRLENDGYIKGGYYNRSAMDRTKWYTLTDLGRELTDCKRIDGQNDSDNCPNANGEKNLSTIEHNKTNSIKHSNTRAQDCSPELAEALREFEEHRKKLHKPMTDKAKELLLAKLSKLGRTEQEQIAILNQSILNGWQGVFPLGGEKKQQSYNRPTAADMAEQAKQLLREKRGVDNDGTGTGHDNGNANSRPAWFSCQ